MPFEYKRGVLWGQQDGLVATGETTPASDLIPLNFVIDADITRTLNKDDPKYLRYKEWLLLRRIMLDRIGAWKLTVEADSSEIGYFLVNLYGMPDVTGATSLFTDANGATRLPGTLAIITEDAGEWDRAPDAWVAEMKWSGDPRGRVKVEISGPCLAEAPQLADKPTWEPSPPPDRSPFSGWQNLISVNGDPKCVESWSLTLKNAVTPRICSPASLPTSGDLDGAVPRNWQFEGLSAMFDGTLDYDGYSGSPLEHMLTGVADEVVLHATDAKTTGLGYTPGILITVPSVDWDKANKLYPKNPLSLEVSGAVQDSVADGFAVAIALTNGVTY